MQATVKQLFTYPIKGLTPQECDRVVLSPGHGIKGDRAFALMFDDCAPIPLLPADAVPWMSKKNFAVQNDWPGLAALECRYDRQKGELSVSRQGIMLLTAPTNTAEGRDRIATFFTGALAYMHPTDSARHPQQARLHLVGTGTGETRYPDREGVHISLLSQATLDELSDVSGQQVDVRRFRPNVLLEGVPAWAEFDWVGQELQLGEAKIAIAARINRCANIEVNPDTGDRDLPLLALLKKHYDHVQTGILAKVLTGGTLAKGDRLSINKE